MDKYDVLLVDDEQEFLQTIVKRLKKRGINASGETSAEKALLRLQNGPVDVVVLDVKMPGMDGIEVLREIKKLHPLVEVIMLTGHANVEVAVRGMELGAFDYLMKPMEIDELVYKLEDAYKNKALQQQRIKKTEEVIGKVT